jgi:hypothetical protein
MLVKMIRADDGHAVDVHPEMVADYMTGGYREVSDSGEQAIRETEAKAETEAETPVKRRGRPRKAD